MINWNEFLWNVAGIGMFRKILELVKFFEDIVDNRQLLFSLAKNDFKSKYSGSFFGILWAFAQPLVTIFVFWFVFEVGFKSMPIQGYPFILWFICGYLPWVYFSDSLISSSSCLYEYSYLVKKVRFHISLLPLVKVISASFVHLFFLGFLIATFLLSGMKPMWYYFQVIYYFFALCFLIVGISWIASSVSAFFKDMSQIINIILQIGFWILPIFWNELKVTPTIQFILKINPMFYIIRGYRDCFIDMIPFWHRPYTTTFFWIEAVTIFIAGALIYRRLRPHFADVL